MIGIFSRKTKKNKKEQESVSQGSNNEVRGGKQVKQEERIKFADKPYDNLEDIVDSNKIESEEVKEKVVPIKILPNDSSEWDCFKRGERVADRLAKVNKNSERIEINSIYLDGVQGQSEFEKFINGGNHKSQSEQKSTSEHLGKVEQANEPKANVWQSAGKETGERGEEQKKSQARAEVGEDAKIVKDEKKERSAESIDVKKYEDNIGKRVKNSSLVGKETSKLDSKRGSVAYMPLYYVVENLDGRSYGKMVCCYLDSDGLVVDYDDEVIDFVTVKNGVIGYIFADKMLDNIMSKRFLNVKLDNLDAYLEHMRTSARAKGGANFSDESVKSNYTYRRTKEQIVKIAKEYLKRETGGYNINQMKQFKSDFNDVMRVDDDSLLYKIKKMKADYRRLNEVRKSGENAGPIERCSIEEEENFINFMPIFCIMEDDFSLSTVSVLCECFQNGDIEFKHNFEITKGFDVEKIGNVYEDENLQNQLMGDDFIVDKLSNVLKAYNSLKSAVIDVESERTGKNAIYKCEDLVNCEESGNKNCEKQSGKNAKVADENKGKEDDFQVAYENEASLEKADATMGDVKKIENLIEKGNIDICLKSGTKVYGVLGETKRSFYLVAKRFLDSGSAFVREEDDLNANLIINQISNIPMEKLKSSILELRERIDFIYDSEKDIRIARPRKQSLRTKRQLPCAVIDFNAIKKDEIQLL